MAVAYQSPLYRVAAVGLTPWPSVNATYYQPAPVVRQVAPAPAPAVNIAKQLTASTMPVIRAAVPASSPDIRVDPGHWAGCTDCGGSSSSPKPAASMAVASVEGAPLPPPAGDGASAKETDAKATGAALQANGGLLLWVILAVIVVLVVGGHGGGGRRSW